MMDRKKILILIAVFLLFAIGMKLASIFSGSTETVAKLSIGKADSSVNVSSSEKLMQGKPDTSVSVKHATPVSAHVSTSRIIVSKGKVSSSFIPHPSSLPLQTSPRGALPANAAVPPTAVPPAKGGSDSPAPAVSDSPDTSDLPVDTLSFDDTLRNGSAVSVTLTGTGLANCGDLGAEISLTPAPDTTKTITRTDTLARTIDSTKTISRVDTLKITNEKKPLVSPLTVGAGGVIAGILAAVLFIH